LVLPSDIEEGLLSWAKAAPTSPLLTHIELILHEGRLGCEVVVSLSCQNLLRIGIRVYYLPNPGPEGIKNDHLDVFVVLEELLESLLSQPCPLD